MKRSIFIIATLLLATIALSQNTEYGNDDFKITNVEVTYHTNLDVLIKLERYISKLINIHLYT